jgi:uncharacterized protein YutE (UPF0331/DUF86 family)
MVDKDLLSSKLTELADRRARVQTHRPESAAALLADRDALDIVSFNLMLCVQICADIASHLIADEGWAAASSLAQGFTRLEEHDVLSGKTAEALRNAVGFRNVVAHGYSRLDAEMAYHAATTGLTDLDSFAREVTAWMVQTH